MPLSVTQHMFRCMCDVCMCIWAVFGHSMGGHGAVMVGLKASPGTYKVHPSDTTGRGDVT